MADEISAHGRAHASARLRVWYLHRLQPRLAVAVKERGVSAAQAAAFDRMMRELLGLQPHDLHALVRSRPHWVGGVFTPAARRQTSFKRSGEVAGAMTRRRRDGEGDRK